MMGLKRFESVSMEGALKLVKEELGDNAVIFSTKTKKKHRGAFGLLGRKTFEVTACTESSTPHILPEFLIALYNQMVIQGVEEQLALKLVKEVKKQFPHEMLKREEYAKIALAHIMGMVIPSAKPLKIKSGKPAVLAFVGPTGMGKTTTIAKLAATHVLKHRKKLALVTLDTCRIGAVEQLTIFGEAMKIPVEASLDKNEFSKILYRHSDKEIIFVDTAGINQSSYAWVDELRYLFSKDIQLEIHLVLSCTTKDEELTRIVQLFQTFPVDRILFTKLDESTTFGTILNQTVKSKLPVSYFSTGQRVPEDIEGATKERIIDLVLNISGMDRENG